MSIPYSNLSTHYDRLMSDVDYESIFNFVLSAYIKSKNTKPDTIIELACGTGNFAIQAAKQGYRVTGVDISDEMLRIAKDKSRKQGLLVTFINQDISRLKLKEKYELAVCCYDGINHITDEDKLRDVFVNVSRCLLPGGLFIFDVNSAYKFSHIYSDNVYYESYDDLTYIWQNQFDKKTGIASFELTFFQKDTDGKYIRYDETIHEKYYSKRAIDKAVKKSELQRLAIYDGYSYDEPVKRSQRHLYIFKKTEDLFK